MIYFTVHIFCANRVALKYLLLYILTCLLFSANSNSVAQDINQYNINIYNELPSNHVYNLTKDHFGYLWIGTDKGVARYNGYSLKVFDFPEGFVNKDVWNLFEDKKGRMWLFSISDKLSYIYKNKYHNVVNKTPEIRLYPRLIKDYKDGVIIIGTPGRGTKYYTERNDTLLYDASISAHNGVFIIDTNNDLYTVEINNDIYKINIAGDKSFARKVGKINILPPTKKNTDLMHDVWFMMTCFSDHIFHTYNPYTKHIGIFDFRRKTFREVVLSELTGRKGSDDILMMCPKLNELVAVTKGHAFTFDADFHLEKAFNIDSNFTIPPEHKITYFLDDPFWGHIAATATNGFYTSYGADSVYQRITAFDLAYFNYVGSLNDSVCYWWNNSTNTLALIEKNKHIRYCKYDIDNVARVIPYSQDTSLLMSQGNTYKLDKKSLKKTLLMNGLALDTIRKGDIYFDMKYLGWFDAVSAGSDNYYAISKRDGFYNLHVKGGKAFFGFIDNDRYKGIVYDSLRDCFLVYNNHKILIYQKDQKPFIVSEKRT